MNRSFPEHIFDAIGDIQRSIRSRHHQLSREHSDGIAGMEFKALRFIAATPGATQKDLVERSGRDKGQIARIISNLKKQGLVVGIADEKDRRITRLQVTEQCAPLLAGFEQLNRQMAEQAVAGLTDDECQTLLSLLGKVGANLKQE